MASGWNITFDSSMSNIEMARFNEIFDTQNGRLIDTSLTKTHDGCGGAYIVGKNRALFKPVDEEYQDPDVKYKYEGYIREVAAYEIDSLYNGFLGVPKTVPVIAQNRLGEIKRGSLQEFVHSKGSAEDYGSSMMPVTDVQKIGILDIIIFNNDRHFGNILIKNSAKKSQHLIPIDHGASLPRFDDLGRARFEWMQWPQSKLPFEKDMITYIDSINIKKNQERLKKIGIEDECIATSIICTRILKRASRMGLCLWDIGNLIQRNLNENNMHSVLERVLLSFNIDSHSSIIKRQIEIAKRVVGVEKENASHFQQSSCNSIENQIDIKNESGERQNLSFEEKSLFGYLQLHISINDFSKLTNFEILIIPLQGINI